MVIIGHWPWSILPVDLRLLEMISSQAITEKSWEFKKIQRRKLSTRTKKNQETKIIYINKFSKKSSWQLVLVMILNILKISFVSFHDF